MKQVGRGCHVRPVPRVELEESSGHCVGPAVGIETFCVVIAREEHGIPLG